MHTYLVFTGYRVPKNMNSTAAVSAILNQEPGKLKASELRTSHEALDNPLGNLVRRQVREASFVQMVKERQDQERASQYKWYLINMNGKLHTYVHMC